MRGISKVFFVLPESLLGGLVNHRSLPFFFLKLIALNEFFCIGLLDRGNWMGTAKEIRWRFNVFQLSDFVSSSIFRVSLQNLWLMDNVISTLQYMYLNIHVTW